jgi:hypothetical protein
VHWLAEASQKFTWPCVSGLVPTITAAVKVTTLPAATVVTALPPEDTVKVVVVAGGTPHNEMVPEALAL